VTVMLTSQLRMSRAHRQMVTTVMGALQVLQYLRPCRTSLNQQAASSPT